MGEEIKGKAKGGHARAKKLTPEQRQEIAKKGAEARWSYANEGSNLAEGKNLLRATHDAPLKIGDYTIQSAVLEDGTRVLTRASLIRAIGRTGKAKGGREYDDEFKIPVFLTAKNLKLFISDKLIENSTPIIFNLKGREAIGYRAELLPEICGVFIDADEANVLAKNQQHIAKKCKILLRGFATVGIIALIDEATGYQYDRDRYELNKILEAYVAKEFLPWAKRFGDEFYREMFRLHGWKYDPSSVKRPILIAKRTTDITYDRLPPGVKEEIKRKNPKSEKTGRYKHKHFQYLTNDIGIPHLDKLYTVSCALMKVARDWNQFIDMYDRAVPKPGTTPKLFSMEEMQEIE